MDLQVRVLYLHAVVLFQTAESLCCCSCSSQRNIWANRTALQFFNKNIQQFVALDYSGPVVGTVTKEDFAAFNALNSLVHEEVEVSW